MSLSNGMTSSLRDRLCAALDTVTCTKAERASVERVKEAMLLAFEREPSDDSPLASAAPAAPPAPHSRAGDGAVSLIATEPAEEGAVAADTATTAAARAASPPRDDSTDRKGGAAPKKRSSRASSASAALAASSSLPLETTNAPLPLVGRIEVEARRGGRQEERMTIHREEPAKDRSRARKWLSHARGVVCAVASPATSRTVAVAFTPRAPPRCHRRRRLLLLFPLLQSRAGSRRTARRARAALTRPRRARGCRCPTSSAPTASSSA